jgi:hypothetical protein
MQGAREGFTMRYFVVALSALLLMTLLPAPGAAMGACSFGTPSGSPTGGHVSSSPTVTGSVSASCSGMSCPYVLAYLYLDGSFEAADAFSCVSSGTVSPSYAASNLAFGVHHGTLYYYAWDCSTPGPCLPLSTGQYDWYFAVGAALKTIVPPMALEPIPGGTPAESASLGDLHVYDNGAGHTCIDLDLGGAAPPQTINVACLSQATLGPAAPLIPLGTTPLSEGVGAQDLVVTVSVFYAYDDARVAADESSFLGGAVKVAPPTADDLTWLQSNGSGAALFVFVNVANSTGGPSAGSNTLVIPYVGQLLGAAQDTTG